LATPLQGQAFLNECLKSRSRQVEVVCEEAQKGLARNEATRRLVTDRFCIAAPPPISRASTKAGPHGVERDVATNLETMTLGLDEFGVVTPLKDMPDLAVTAVKGLRKQAVQTLHAERKVGFRRRDNEMVMSRHQAERLARPLMPLDDVRQDSLEAAPVIVVAEDRSSCASSSSHVIRATGNLDSQRTRHESSVDRSPTSRQPGSHSCDAFLTGSDPVNVYGVRPCKESVARV
jgi:hypothetical protein